MTILPVVLNPASLRSYVARVTIVSGPLNFVILGQPLIAHFALQTLPQATLVPKLVKTEVTDMGRTGMIRIGRIQTDILTEVIILEVVEEANHSVVHQVKTTLLMAEMLLVTCTLQLSQNLILTILNNKMMPLQIT